MRVLIATDGSEPSLEAARLAIPLLHPGLEAQVVTVMPEFEDPMDMAGGFEGPLVTEEQAEAEHQQAAEAAVSALGATLAELPAPAKVIVREAGDAGKAICDVAAERGADVLVVGASEHGWFRRLLHGSVTEYVVRHAPCPVLVVRHADEAAGTAERQGASGAAATTVSAPATGAGGS